MRAQAADATEPGATATARYVVEFAPAAVPGRLERLQAIRAGIRAGVAPGAHAAAVAELTATLEPARATLRAAVAELGGDVLGEFLVLPGAGVALRPADVARLAAAPIVAAITPEQRFGPHIRRSTSAANHAADSVQALPVPALGAGATLALLDSGVDARCGALQAPHPTFGTAPDTEGTRLLAVLGFASPQDTEDLDGHGTAVAAIAAGRSWSAVNPDSDDGFAPRAGIASLKITAGSAPYYLDLDLLAAIDAIAARRVEWNAGVANLSWAGPPSPNLPTPRALDDLAFYFDVLVVTSAGNDGLQSNPTARSFSNANGLSVAAISPDSHLYWEPSSFGPLLGDPQRSWPDLAAVGVGLRTPRPDQPDATGPVRDGTSFAAPAVAGTALVLRGDDPSLSTLDTKALLLHGVRELRTANPDRTQWHYGLGMLRTDQSLDAARHDAIHRGFVLQAGPQPAITVTANVPGQALAATLCWPRVDSSTGAWDDLDLTVEEPGGRVLAVASHPRNLYERVLFTAPTAGTYTLRIDAVALPDPGLPYTLVVGPNRSGDVQPGEYSFGAVSQGCPTSSPDPLGGTEAPGFAAGRFGNARSAFPLAATPCRLLMVVARGDIPPGAVIDIVGLRRDEISFGFPGYDVDLEMWLAPTLRSPQSPVPTFAQNYDRGMPAGPAMARRSVHVPGDLAPPRDYDVFDALLPLDRPFDTATLQAGENLLLEFRVFAHSRGSQAFGLAWDAEFSPLSIVVVSDTGPLSVQGFLDPLTPTVALFDSARLGSSVPCLHVDGVPQLGAGYELTLTRGSPGAPTALLHGLHTDTWGPVALPYALDRLGAPGCALAARPDTLVPLDVDATGRATLRILVPLDPLLTGLPFDQQALILDPAANPLGLAATPPAHLRVGG